MSPRRLRRALHSRRRRLARASLLACAIVAAGGEDARAQRAAGTGGAPAGGDTSPHPYRPGFDVLDYDLTLDLPDSGKAIAGRAVLAVRRTGASPRPDTLVLDLVGLRVDSVLVDGRAVRFRRDARTLRVPLGAEVRDSFSVAVRYGGEPSDGLIIGTDDRGRWMAFGDNWPNRARHWIPSVDHPSDKATVTWTVTAPAGRVVVANGAFETAIGGSHRTVETTRWRESRPIPVYTMVIAAAPLVEVPLGSAAACGRGERSACVRQTAYTSPESRGLLPGPFADANRMMDYFSAVVAPFPYEKLAHVQSTTRFGGMENASTIFYNDASFRARKLGAGTVAHEIAHQWFGDAVTPRDWPHVWLSEGFASYFAQLWVEHSLGDAAFRAEMDEMRARVLASPVTAQRPVLDSAERDPLALLNSNSYDKGAWVLHMLRATVGDSAFFGGVRAYYERHRHATATTDDLRRAMELAAGRELGWFFDQWLRRPGAVDADAAWSFDPARGRLTLSVTQRTGAAPYRFPLVVEVAGAEGRRQRATVDVPARRTATLEVPLSLGSAPRGVVLDPDVRVLGAVRSRQQ
jgi:aminopeptidase N